MASTNSEKSLVIVESPAKAKTINKYLGSNFEVKASMGHIRDLPSKGLNVDIEHQFEPKYDILPGKKKIVSELKQAAKKSDKVYLATDLDREGEAIAWHLAEALNLADEKTFRVVFNAITKNDIQKAFANPGKIDMYRVMAQQARRILDRIVGYQISPLLWKKISAGLSAGRVQSVAVKMIVQREREIRAFKPQEYWLIPAIFTTDSRAAEFADQWKQLTAQKENTPISADQLQQWLTAHQAFKADLTAVNGQKFRAENQQCAQELFEKIQRCRFSVADISTRRTQSRPAAPFITSTLQQAAANRLGFSANRTMLVAQQLYEGIDLGSMGALGLITYMRTDSTYLSQEAIQSARAFIEKQFGNSYLPEKPNYYAPSEHAQQAHEAIRPTDPDLTPDEIRSFLTDDQYKLYDLIWRRFLACQMAPAIWDTTKVEIIGTADDFICHYRANGRVMIFDGFTRVWDTATEEPPLPAMQANQPLWPIDIHTEQHFTKPPARYTEATLIKALEKEGIGRPSTYATIISTIQERKYVEKKDKKFYATPLGELVTDKLEQFFPELMNVAFTREMEQKLDQIEEKHLDWVQVLEEFYKPFKASLEQATQLMKHAKAETEPSPYTCPDCGKPLVYRFGKTGRFLSCSTYPTCKFASPCDADGKMAEPPTQQPTEHLCPTCGKPMVLKKSRFGAFLGCSDYPNCKTIVKMDKEGNPLPPKPAPVPTDLACHKCKTGKLVIRQSKRGPFLGCDKFPRCRTIISYKKLEMLKELAAKGQWPPASEQEAQAILKDKETKKT